MTDRPPWDPRPTSWVHHVVDAVVLGTLAAARWLVDILRGPRG